ncbi:Zinc finger protein CONSTANS-LIKE 10 [Symbiodinium microadriaticum]|uniref:Zinc finger protein CONSTANS-LIKE 10 n=2 Tax=Symbiodinium TaxID=2949 RepID=A0A1Q9CNR9_SYMMI|nr:Zinc finger protein CONSTANS-LIKE 10 [Symbiodinium microadriaticum]
MNKARAMLDALMGPGRDQIEKEGKGVKEKFKDDSVCKSFLVGLCPLDASILGGKRKFKVCEKIHSELMKDQLAKHPDAEQLKREYEKTQMRDLDFVIRECEAHIASEKNRIREDVRRKKPPLPIQVNDKLAQMKRESSALIQRAEALDDDKVREKEELIQQANDVLKERESVLEEETKKAIAALPPQEVCELVRTSRALLTLSWLLQRPGHGAMELHKAHDQPFAVPVTRRSPEWGWLEYLLHASCSTYRLRLRSAWSVANKRLNVEFESRCKGLLQLHAWLPVAEIPFGQTVEDICRNGFKAGHTGVSFHVGNLQLPSLYSDGRDRGGNDRGHNVKSRGRSLPAGRRLYEFLLCRLGAGRSYLIDNPSHAETLALPPEYDSFFTRHSPANEQVIHEEYPGVLPRHVLHHEYMVRDPAQALPVYLVHFEFDPEMPELLNLPLCDHCGLQAAMVYCEADDAIFCRPCDSRIHSANKLAARHIRVDINRRPNAPLGNCPDHAGSEADMYCTECKVPVCQHCRKLGSHSAGEAKKHRLVNLREAYQHALKASTVTANSVLTDRQRVESQQVSELDRRLVTVQESTQALEDGIYDQVQLAVKQGQALAEEQALLLMADELEAKRQLDQAAWMDSFLEEHVKNLPPPDFLEAWLQHAKVRQEVSQLGRLTEPRSSATLRLEGGLRLVADTAEATWSRPGDAPGGVSSSTTRVGVCGTVYEGDAGKAVHEKFRIHEAYTIVRKRMDEIQPRVEEWEKAEKAKKGEEDVKKKEKENGKLESRSRAKDKL